PRAPGEVGLRAGPGVAPPDVAAPLEDEVAPVARVARARARADPRGTPHRERGAAESRLVDHPPAIPGEPPAVGRPGRPLVPAPGRDLAGIRPGDARDPDRAAGLLLGGFVHERDPVAVGRNHRIGIA